METMKRAVCALIYRDATKSQLLGISRRNKPEDMNLPGGKVDPGETSEDALRREVKEEVDLDVLSAALVFQRPCYGEDNYEASCYEVTYRGVPKAVEQGFVIRWISWGELLDPKNSFASYNQQLHDHLRASGLIPK